MKANDPTPQRNLNDYPLPRAYGEVRTLDRIRGKPCRQMRTGQRTTLHNNANVRMAYDRRRKLKRRIELEIDKKAAELRTIDAELAAREEIRDLATKAPSVKEMRAATAQLFKEMDLNPIKELINIVKRRGKGALTPKEKAQILKELAQYQAPKPKAVDVQAEMDMNVSVGMMDFRGMSQKKIIEVTEAAADEEYGEFEHSDDE